MVLVKINSCKSLTIDQLTITGRQQQNKFQTTWSRKSHAKCKVIFVVIFILKLFFVVRIDLYN